MATTATPFINTPESLLGTLALRIDAVKANLAERARLGQPYQEQQRRWLLLRMMQRATPYWSTDQIKQAYTYLYLLDHE